MKAEDVKVVPKWSKSKEEIWNETFAELDETKISPKRGTRFPWKYVAAAIVTLLIVTGSFAYFHTITEQAERGSHLAITLPDGSAVKLNAESKLSYKPYAWFISRNVQLEGEGFFEVKPGRRFTVRSNQNEVRVLGTSFNVFARAGNYSVTCLTGKVEVLTAKGNAILTPQMQANLRKGAFRVSEKEDTASAMGWTQNKFSFIGVPLTDVVQEIERQYDIHVSTTANLDYLYTGNFSKEKNPEEVLEIVGKPFGITFKIEP